MKSKKSLLVSLILISAMTFASCSGNDAYDDVKISGDEVIRISIPDMASDGEPEASASEEPQTSESSSSAPETLIISQLNDRHAFGTRSDTYGFIPERYKEMLDRAMYVLVGDIGDGETIGNGLEELYQARKAMPDREELLSHTGYVIADFDGNGTNELMIFVLTGSEDSGKAFRITTLYSLASQDSLVLLKASGHKENFYMLPDGKLYYTGMTDAVRHSVGLFAISPNGTSVEPVELYFTDYTDPLDTGSEYGWFRSYDGRVTSETSHEYDYMGEDFDPAIKADIIEFTPNEYCLFKDLRHRYEIVPDEVDPKDVEDLCRELGGHPLNINDRYEEQVINGLLKDEKYADKIFLIRDGVYVKVVKNEDGIALEESMEKTQGTGYICEFDY